MYITFGLLKFLIKINSWRDTEFQIKEYIIILFLKGELNKILGTNHVSHCTEFHITSGCIIEKLQ